MRTLTQPLNMSPGGIPPVIHVSQYDSDFTITFTLFSLFGGFTIESGTTAQIRGTKSSGTGYSADAAINISAKTVTVTGDAQMTAAAGQNIFEVVLKKNNKEISSKNFILHVERAALDADTITDESVLKELNAIIESADTATQAAEEAEDAADRAEAAAQSLVIDSTPTQGSSNAVSSGGVYDALQSAGLSEDAKTALLACFRHVAWTDEHGQDYYDALESALYGSEPQWDYEWDATSTELPEGATYSSYDWTTEPGALILGGGNLDFNYIGDCEIEIVAKYNANYGSSIPVFKVTYEHETENEYKYVAVTLDKQNNDKHSYENTSGSYSSTGILFDEYHTYNVAFKNGVGSVTIDGDLIGSGLGAISSSNGLTGISCWANDALAYYKSIKFRRL